MKYITKIQNTKYKTQKTQKMGITIFVFFVGFLYVIAYLL